MKLFSGPLLVIDAVNQGDTLDTIQVKKIPTRVELQQHEMIYNLVGCALFKAPAITTRRSNEEASSWTLAYSIHHYTALLCHSNGEWTEIDDLGVTEKSMKTTTVVSPYLLIYARSL